MIDRVFIRVVLAALADWLDHQQQDVIAYLVEENRILRSQLAGRRLRLSDQERCRLARRGRRLGRRLLRQVATIVTPDTILRWASTADRAQVDVRHETIGPSDRRRGDPTPDRADGGGESALGLHQNPGCV